MDNMVANVKSIKIAFLIRDLGSGGAERQLVLLANALSCKYDITVITFYSVNNFYAEQLSQSVRFITLDKKGRWDFLFFFIRFYKIMKRHKFDLLYAFMSNAEFVAYLYHFFNRQLSIVWGIRSSNMDTSRYGKLYNLLRKIECKISVNADAIISNSFAGKFFAIKDGFVNKQIHVVQNGIDTERFIYSDTSRVVIRKQLGIPFDALVIGVVARHDPMKGLNYFIEAGNFFLKEYPNTFFLIIGSGPIEYSMELKEKALQMGITNKILWLPAKSDIEYYYSAMDIYTSSSVYGEGFSNTIGEAMSCGLPCVVTNIGDSEIIVGEEGIVVEPCDVNAIVAGWKKNVEKLETDKKKLQMQQRKRILDYFSIENLSVETERILLQTIYNKSKA